MRTKSVASRTLMSGTRTRSVASRTLMSATRTKRTPLSRKHSRPEKKPTYLSHHVHFSGASGRFFPFLKKLSMFYRPPGTRVRSGIEQRARREAKKGRTAVSDEGGEEVGTMSRIWESRERGRGTTLV